MSEKILLNSIDNDSSRNIESENNSKKAEKIEYFILHGSWDNSWVTMTFCRQCGKTFGPEINYNVYRVKDLFFCETDYNMIQQRHKEKGIEWKGELYWASLQSSPELQ
jgi:hypothetical protein